VRSRPRWRCPLFSEPKIPQKKNKDRVPEIVNRGQPALQRAENSSKKNALERQSVKRVGPLFSEPKIPQKKKRAGASRGGRSEGALQRAENS